MPTGPVSTSHLHGLTHVTVNTRAAPELHQRRLGQADSCQCINKPLVSCSFLPRFASRCPVVLVMPSSPPVHTNTLLMCCRPDDCLKVTSPCTVHTRHLVPPLLLLSGVFQLFSERPCSHRTVLLQLPLQILQLHSLPARQTQRRASDIENHSLL